MGAATARQLSQLADGSERYIHPFLGGEEMLHSLGPGRFIVGLPHDDMLAAESAAPAAMAHLKAHVLPARQAAAAKEAARNAEILDANPGGRVSAHHAKFLSTRWQHSWRRPDMVEAIESIDRYIALTITASLEWPSVYTFVSSGIRPAASVHVFPFDDDYSFGVLSSAPHRQWFEARCSTLETRLRYTPTTVFDSFPWPQVVSSADVKTIVEVVAELLELRKRHLEQGVVLARQYNTLRQPGKSQLRGLHEALDEAVIRAYGFTDEDDLLAQLLALNLDFAANPLCVRLA